jgi:polyhydroxyalkanoate synthesis regulator phasin
MRMRRGIFGAALVVASVAAIGWGSHKEASLEELKARAESAKPDERATLCIQIAERQVEAADRLYTDGKLEQAQAAIHDVVTYSQKGADAAGQTGHKLKNTEIALRKMAHRLVDIKRTLAFDNQAPVQDAADALERLRTQVLNRMFGKNAK